MPNLPDAAVPEGAPPRRGRILVVESDTAAIPHYMPGHPLANEDGYVFSPGINAIEEMADMISASRSYSSSVEVLSTTKELMLRTLQLGRG